MKSKNNSHTYKALGIWPLGLVGFVSLIFTWPPAVFLILDFINGKNASFIFLIFLLGNSVTLLSFFMVADGVAVVGTDRFFLRPNRSRETAENPRIDVAYEEIQAFCYATSSDHPEVPEGSVYLAANFDPYLIFHFYDGSYKCVSLKNFSRKQRVHIVNDLCKEIGNRCAFRFDEEERRYKK